MIHCLGPVHGVDAPADQLLAICYQQAIRIADEADCQSIAFPATSTGAFGFPMLPSARIALRTVMDELQHVKAVNLSRFVLFDDRALAIHSRVLAELARVDPAPDVD